jgi:hypothetical protein
VVVSRPASKKAQQAACASPNRNNNQLPSTTETTITSHNSNINNNCSTDDSINQRRRSNEDIDDNNRCSTSTSTAATSYQAINSFGANMTTATAPCDNEYLTMCSNLAQSCSASSFNVVDDIQLCDNESTVGSSCSSKSSSNEIEESCLLGIDCNEKTTVGLVLKVLADTAIRLDGDG